MTEQERYERWVQKLHNEWLPNWRDMPDMTFAWWNLLIVLLDDARTDAEGNVVIEVVTSALPSSTAPRPAPAAPCTAQAAPKP